MISAIEKEIVSLLERGDKKAINLLYEYYADSLYGVIQKIIKDEDTAQDVLLLIKLDRKKISLVKKSKLKLHPYIK